ncbi:MAG: hypothetical protein A2939_03700 [Parcubacteria group bacterium RIFCSPLOWO2_01_FULL_48_18]|nr:MAG: hypothetical protein A3J67_02640 [Parcubacteria group bacterium RIFCSPHIGHO2_02_FULL_48_10b]OHB22382.1 MAG: hypothetical protein A2939_03700 [Parcubacteria group bacterium RIFCSPLOWO2_01_FULL_48_18]
MKLVIPSLVLVIFFAVSTHSAFAALSNPLDPCKEITCILDKFAAGLWWIGSPLAVIFVLWGAIQILTAGGDVERLKKGKSTITYAIIGLIILFAGAGVNLIIQSLLK